MKKSLIDLICIFGLVLSITLYFSPDSLNEMFEKSLSSIFFNLKLYSVCNGVEK
jgi:hypothetical protein